MKLFGKKPKTRTVAVGGAVVTAAAVPAFVFLSMAGNIGKPVTEKYESIVLGEYYDTSEVLTWCGGETNVGRLPEGEEYTYEYCKPLFDAQWDVYSARMFGCYSEKMLPYITVGMHVAFTDTHYNTGARCQSGMIRAIRRGEPVAACEFLTNYRFSSTPRGGRLDMLDGKKNGKMDCSLTEGESRGCYGIWKRRMEFYEMCRVEAKQLEKTL